MAEANRIYEMAKQFGMTSKQLLAVTQEIGVVAKSHMSVLEGDDVALVRKHLTKLGGVGRAAKGTQGRVEVEKAKPKEKRLTAKEKLAARRAEQEIEKKAAAEKRAEEGPAEDEGAAGVKPKRKREMVTMLTPSEPRAAVDAKAPAPAGDSSKSATAAAAAKPRLRPKPKVDLDAVAKAAAKTTSRIVDDLKTRQAEPQALPQPRNRGRQAPTPAPATPRADEHKPKPIDPSAIRNSVRKALGKIEVERPQRQQQVPPHLRPKRKPAKRAREDKRDRVARHRAREDAEREEQSKIRLSEFITVSELAHKLEVPAGDLIVKLIGLGVMATMNHRLERAQIDQLLVDYEQVEVQWLEDAAQEEVDLLANAGGELSTRPPVVTVMGHVDHGKTTLLDFLRKSNVTAGEAGGITQHIGAYQVETDRGVITFLDTPGHEAFTAMRARGARATDIVVVVVAADDKVMPQTREAISHARASACPIVIAINKIDLPAADPAAVKQQLMQESVLIEEFGGDVQCVEISAKRGTNVDQLLEALILQAELLELQAIAEGPAQGVVIEARKDMGRGVVFTVLVRRGTLRAGDAFVVGTASGRVRAVLDEHDDAVEFAGPSRPVVVLGADEVPTAGDKLNVMPSEKEAKEVANKRRHVHREQLLHAPKKHITLEDLYERMQVDEQVELPVIIKGDVAGSVEALSDNLLSLSNEKVAVRVIHSAVGAISENDIGLAAASGALIIGFHLRPTPQIRHLAKEQQVDLRLYDIIYEVVAEVKGAMKGMLKPIEREVATGSAEVRDLFRVPKIGVIAGSYVIDGIIKRNSKVRVVRDQIQIYESKVSSLKRFKEDAREVKNGFECGIGVEGFQDLKVGDILELFEIVEEPAEL